MSSIFIRSVKAIRRYVISIETADITGFGVHHFGKALYGTTHMLRLGFILCLSINVYGQDTEKPEGQTEIPSELRQLYAQSAVLMDADSGRVLFEKNGYEQKPMASTTKIMTVFFQGGIYNRSQSITQ